MKRSNSCSPGMSGDKRTAKLKDDIQSHDDDIPDNNMDDIGNGDKDNNELNIINENMDND